MNTTTLKNSPRNEDGVHVYHFRYSLLAMIAMHSLFWLVYSASMIHYSDYLTSEDSVDSAISPMSLKMQMPKSGERNKYEAGYPKVSRVHWFPTSAAGKEMARHDRYLIHGLLYTQKLTREYLEKHWSFEEIRRDGQPPLLKKKICVNIFMKNRALPYINALIMTLMGSHQHDEKTRFYKTGMAGEGSPLLSHTYLNLFDTERHSDRLHYDDIRQDVMKLPFLNLHRTADLGGGKSRRSGSSPKLEKIQDYLASANICVLSNLQWCLMMEEYSVVPIEFLTSLQNFVTAPMESLALAHSTPEQSDSFLAGEFSVISLFSAFDWNSRTPLAVHNPDYSEKLYEFDRGKLNSERKSLDLGKYRPNYDMYPITNDDYTKSVDESNVALLFTNFIVKEKLIPFLRILEKEEERRISGWQSKMKYEHRVSGLNLEFEFAKYTGINRYQVEPSLVNRIGFYDEDVLNYDNFRQHRLGITNWHTDPRFLFEGGEYFEGVDLYCQTEDGTWYYDYNYYEDNYYEDKQSFCVEHDTEKNDPENQ